MGIASDSVGGARVEYARRLGARRETAAIRSRHAAIAANLRLLVFAAGALVAWFVFGSGILAAGWLAPPILLFVALVFAHDRLLAERQRALRSVAFYERALTRLESRWAGGGTQGERFRDPHHPYADDLDLVGEGSLFEFLCAARTRAGEDTLAAWLLESATPEQIRRRQEAVREFTPHDSTCVKISLGSATRSDPASIPSRCALGVRRRPRSPRGLRPQSQRVSPPWQSRVSSVGW
jgi:hypothetical protein